MTKVAELLAVRPPAVKCALALSRRRRPGRRRPTGALGCVLHVRSSTLLQSVRQVPEQE